MTITSSTRCSVMSSHVGLDMCGVSEICGIHLIHMFCGIFRFCVVCSSNAPANYSCAPFLCLLRTLFSLSVTFPFPQSPWEYRLLCKPSFAILVSIKSWNLSRIWATMASQISTYNNLVHKSYLLERKGTYCEY